MNKVVPIYSAVVRLEDGKVTSVEWDNDCFDCTDLCMTTQITDKITEKNCRTKAEECTGGLSSYNCDPKIYVTFIGTDSNGNHMVSAGLRISRFRQYSISQMYTSAKNTWDSTYEQVDKKVTDFTGTSQNNQNQQNSTTNATNPVSLLANFREQIQLIQPQIPQPIPPQIQQTTPQPPIRQQTIHRIQTIQTRIPLLQLLETEFLNPLSPIQFSQKSTNQT